jgi:uncharacterized protein YndB with AHSA1/START domain
MKMTSERISEGTSEGLIQATATHRFKASPERVFDAWLDPEKVMKWMFPNGDIVRMEIDPRVGGWFSFVDRREGEEVDHRGEYLEIDRPRRLVFSWGMPSYSPDFDRVTVEIVPLEAGCELTLTHEMKAEWADYLDSTKDAWTTMLEALAQTLGALGE